MKKTDLPPKLVSDFVKLLDIFLVENSHVVQALPPSQADHGHVGRGGSLQRHHPERRGSSLGRLGADTPPHAPPALEVKWRWGRQGGRNQTHVDSV